MNKWFKRILIASLVLIAAGGMLAVGGRMLGGQKGMEGMLAQGLLEVSAAEQSDSGIEFDNSHEILSGDFTQELETLPESGAGKLTLEVGNVDVNVLEAEGETASIEGADIERAQAYVEDGTLYVRADSEVKWVKWMFGVIGSPTMLTANLGYLINEVPRLQRPDLAGGALLDVGVYPINFARMIFGDRIAKISSTCTYTDSGVDEQDSITFLYEDGKVAQLAASMLGLSDRRGTIYGTKGFMVIENINNFESLTVYDTNYHEVKRIDRPAQITGYEYEVEACMRALSEGKLECGEMPHEETLRVMELMDGLREEWGVKFPFE